MRKGRNYGLLIAGGGAAGSLAALAVAQVRPDAPLLLVAEEPRFGGGGTLLLFEEWLGKEERALAGPLIERSWDSYYVAFRGGSRKVKAACHVFSAEKLDHAVRDALGPLRYRLGAKVVAIRDDSLLLSGGETLGGDGAIDARGSAPQTTLELGWRHNSERTWRFTEPHRVDRPVLIDATLDSGEDCGFFTCIPVSQEILVIERVDYSASPERDVAAAEARIDDYVWRRGWRGGEVIAQDEESRAVPLGGDFDAYWRIGGARVAKLGARGAFSHPLTGSPLPSALRNAALLARQRDLGGAALHDLFAERASAAWRKRELQRAFTRRLIRAGEGCAAWERLYQLDSALIARFWDGSLGLLERRRILSAAG